MLHEPVPEVGAHHEQQVGDGVLHVLEVVVLVIETLVRLAVEEDQEEGQQAPGRPDHYDVHLQDGASAYIDPVLE